MTLPLLVEEGAVAYPMHRRAHRHRVRVRHRERFLQTLQLLLAEHRPLRYHRRPSSAATFSLADVLSSSFAVQPSVETELAPIVLGPSGHPAPSLRPLPIGHR